MKLFCTITKKVLAITFCSVTIAFLTAIWALSLKYTVIDGSTHEKRMLYITDLGYSVDEEGCTSKETIIPSEFSDVYRNYNRIQKSAGFDLSDYRGKAITVYCYPIKHENKNLTLIVHNGKVIGGDVADTALNGEMKPLSREG